MGRPLAAALLLLAALSASAAEPEFDFDRGVEAPVFAPIAAPAAKPVPARWITMDAGAAVEAAGDAALLGAPIAASGQAAVFGVAPSAVPALAKRVHTRLQSCGGFVSHDSLDQALAFLKAPKAPAFVAPALDQAAFVGMAAGAVSESELRKTISALSAFPDRRFDGAQGVAAASWIKNRWQSLSTGLPGARADLFAHSQWLQPSVVLTIPGATLPDEIVVLGGHLDSTSWGGPAPGADDNASGIAVLTEAIRLLAAAGFKPARTVQFMGYAAEEDGLRGSQEIAGAYAAAGKAVKAVIQFDMTNFKGSADAIYLLDDFVDPQLTAFLASLVNAYAGVPAKRTRCRYGCSDHASWTQKGFAASAAFESEFKDMNKAIHTFGDTLAASGGTAAHSVPFAKLAVAFAVENAKRSP